MFSNKKNNMVLGVTIKAITLKKKGQSAMKRLECSKKAIVLVGFIVILMIGNSHVNADFIVDTAINVGSTINSSYHDFSPWISADGLSLYFASVRPGGSGDFDLWVATRASMADDWSIPANLGATVNSSAKEWFPCISADGLTLYFTRGLTGSDIWVTIRNTIEDAWNPPLKLAPPVNSSATDAWPNISQDGCTLYFGSNRSGGYGDYDIWAVTRTTTNDEWGEAINLGPSINTWDKEAGPCISTDGLSLFLHTRRSDGFGASDLYLTRRETIEDEWSKPINLGPTVNSSYYELCPSVMASGLMLYFSDHLPSPRPSGFGGADLWQVSIEPVVDLNADGIVDSADMCIMVDYWDTDQPLCDIGPTPFGDGIVDVQDLVVLAEHLFTYPGAVAYWKLDEAEGNIAYDSIGNNHGTINGGPAWQPEGGIVDGALQLDGIDDYVSAEFVMNPTESAFSMFVWIKGGAPGQVVLSQKGSASCLCTDASEGNLVTELKGFGRSAAALLSQTVITDGSWHRIGLVWDGSHRTLYVDNVAVAEDIQDGMEGSDSGLYIGAGQMMQPGSFWSGLIDDIRIYSRAVSP